MRIYFNDPIDLRMAGDLVEQFQDELPPDHKDCVYRSRRIITYVKRTKAGNLCVSQWNE